MPFFDLGLFSRRGHARGRVYARVLQRGCGRDRGHV